MAVITDYNTLAAQIQRYLNRNDPDTIAQFEQFIAVSEANVYRDLRVPTMEVEMLAQVGYNSLDENLYNAVGVPGNYLETRVVSIPSLNAIIRPVDYASFIRKRSDEPGTPSVFTRKGNSFVFDRVPSELIEITFAYWRVFEPLSPSNADGVEDPRPFLRVTGDAWLYGALTEAATFLGDSRYQNWLGRYNGAIQSLQRSADMLELSGAPLQVGIQSDDFYGGAGRIGDTVYV